MTVETNQEMDRKQKIRMNYKIKRRNVCRNASLSIDVERVRRRRRSSVDELQMVLSSKEKEGRRKRELAVRPLLKRNTIADFATSKAFHGSTTSLLSAAEQSLSELLALFVTP